MRNLRAIAFATLSLAAASAALAEPGDHLRAGDVVIVPKIDLGTEYRSNVYRTEAGGISSGNLRISPGVTASASTDDTDFSAGFDWELRKFLFVADGALQDDLRAQRISGLDRYNDFALTTALDLTKRSQVGLRLSDRLANRNWTSDAEFAVVPFTSQLRNELVGSVRINPGPALEFSPGGEWDFDNYQRPGDRGERSLNQRHTYGPTLQAKWGFLPRTALVVNGNWMFYRWQNTVLGSAGEFGNQIALPNSQAIKVNTGIDGRFTEKLALQAFIGYGTAIYDEDSVPTTENLAALSDDVTGLEGLLATVNVRYDITEPAEGSTTGSRVTVGYERDFRDSFFTNYVALNQWHAQLDGRLADFEPTVRYQIRLEDYDGDVSRQDIVNRFNADLGYYLNEWALLKTGFWWQQRASSTDNVEYDDFGVHLLASLTY